MTASWLVWQGGLKNTARNGEERGEMAGNGRNNVCLGLLPPTICVLRHVLEHFIDDLMYLGRRQTSWLARSPRQQSQSWNGWIPKTSEVGQISVIIPSLTQLTGSIDQWHKEITISTVFHPKPQTYGLMYVAWWRYWLPLLRELYIRSWLLAKLAKYWPFCVIWDLVGFRPLSYGQ